jgi:hypothetical protein
LISHLEILGGFTRNGDELTPNRMTFPDAEGALAWCRDHGLDREHCYARLVSTTHPIDGSTAFNE